MVKRQSLNSAMEVYEDFSTYIDLKPTCEVFKARVNVFMKNSAIYLNLSGGHYKDDIYFKIMMELNAENNFSTINKLLQKYNVNYQIPDDGFIKYYIPEKMGYTLLHLTVINVNVPDVKYLLDRGADFTIKGQNGFTPLRLAVEMSYGKGHPCLDLEGTIKHPLADILLDKHVETNNLTNPVSQDGFSHFHIACMTNNTKVVEFFLKNGVSVNEAIKMEKSVYSHLIPTFLPSYTPLHIAARYCSVESMKILLKYGANKYIKNNEGMSPLHLLLKLKMDLIEILRRKHFENKSWIHVDLEKVDDAISLLTSHVSDLLESIDNIGLTRLHLACCNLNNVLSDKQLQDLKNINAAVDSSSPHWSGYTPLHFAAHTSIDTFTSLLKCGANIAAKDANGITPVEIFLENYELKDLLNVLSSNDSLKSARFSDDTKLIDVIQFMLSEETFETFLKSRKNVNMTILTDSPIWPGYTLLHLAVLFASEVHKREISDILEKFDYSGLLDFELGSDHITRKDEEDTERVPKAPFDMKKILHKCFEYDIDYTIPDIYGVTPLHLATYLADKEIVDHILNRHGSKLINPVGPDGLSHFHVALCVGNIELVEKFINSGENVNAIVKCDCKFKRKNDFSKDLSYQLNTGLPPLHISLQKNDLKMTELLLSLGADPLIRNSFGFTALHFSFLDPELNLINLLLSDARVMEQNCSSEMGLSHFYVACYANDLQAVERYLKLGADANGAPVFSENLCERYKHLSEYSGCTALHLAAKRKSTQLFVNLLAESAVDIHAKNTKGLSPLHLALEEYFVCVIQLSDITMSKEYKNILDNMFSKLQFDEDEFKDDFGITLLHIACVLMNIDAVEKLLNSGADVNAQITRESPIFSGYTALYLMLSLECNYKIMKPIIELLLKHGADVTIQNSAGQTPIHLAFGSLQDDIMNMLLEGQQDYSINPKNYHGLSHLHVACARNHARVVESLLENGADVDQKHYHFCLTKGFTPLHFTVMANCAEAFHLLLKYKADPTIADGDGRSLIVQSMLHYNQTEQALSILKTLLSLDKTNLIDTPCKCGDHPIFQSSIAVYPLCMFFFNLVVRETDRVFDCDYEAIELMMSHGCRLNKYIIEDGESVEGLFGMIFNMTPYVYTKLFIKMLDTASDVSSIDEKTGRNLIHNLVFTSLNTLKNGGDEVQYGDLVGALTRYGCDLNHRDLTGKTALHLAVIKEHHIGAGGLLLQGIDINLTDDDGKTAFEYCENLDAEDPMVRKLSWYVHRMMLAKIAVGRANERMYRKFYQKYEGELEWRVLGQRKPWTDESCFEELEEMRSVEVFKNLTLRDLLSERLVAEYPAMSNCKRQAIDKYVKKNRNLHRLYAHFGALLYLQHRKALARMEWIEGARNAMHAIAKYALPEHCVDAVLSYLSSADLRTLSDMSKNIAVLKRNDETYSQLAFIIGLTINIVYFCKKVM